MQRTKYKTFLTQTFNNVDHEVFSGKHLKKVRVEKKCHINKYILLIPEKLTKTWGFGKRLC